MKQFVDLNIEIVVGVVISVLERGLMMDWKSTDDVAVACASLGFSVSEY